MHTIWEHIFETEYGELKPFADKQKMIVFVVKMVICGGVGEFLLRKVLLEFLLRRIELKEQQISGAKIWRCILI